MGQPQRSGQSLACSFAAELRRLALNYQSTAIVHFVEQCRPEQVA